MAGRLVDRTVTLIVRWHVYEEILGEMVRVDLEEGDLKQQLADLQELLKVSPAIIISSRLII